MCAGADEPVRVAYVSRPWQFTVKAYQAVSDSGDLLLIAL
jgi:hypothetical protein